MQTNSWFYIFILRLFVTWVLRYAAHTWSRFGHTSKTCNTAGGWWAVSPICRLHKNNKSV